MKKYGKKIRKRKYGEKKYEKMYGKQKYGKKYGKKIEEKSHVTSEEDLFRSLLVKHAQWSDPPRSPSNVVLSVPIYYFDST